MPEINVRYVRNEHYKIVPVSGVWGGINAKGLVYCDFFVEKPEIPKTVVMEVDEKTGKSKEISKEPKEGCLIREILCGVTIQPDIACSIGEWLVAKADEYDKLVRGEIK